MIFFNLNPPDFINVLLMLESCGAPKIKGTFKITLEKK